MKTLCDAGMPDNIYKITPCFPKIKQKSASVLRVGNKDPLIFQIRKNAFQLAPGAVVDPVGVFDAVDEFQDKVAPGVDMRPSDIAV